MDLPPDSFRVKLVLVSQQQEVQKLLEKDAIEEVPTSEQTAGFYSLYFTVPKKKKGGG